MSDSFWKELKVYAETGNCDELFRYVNSWQLKPVLLNNNKLYDNFVDLVQIWSKWSLKQVFYYNKQEGLKREKQHIGRDETIEYYLIEKEPLLPKGWAKNTWNGYAPSSLDELRILQLLDHHGEILKKQGQSMILKHQNTYELKLWLQKLKMYLESFNETDYSVLNIVDREAPQTTHSFTLHYSRSVLNDIINKLEVEILKRTKNIGEAKEMNLSNSLVENYGEIKSIKYLSEKEIKKCKEVVTRHINNLEQFQNDSFSFIELTEKKTLLSEFQLFVDHYNENLELFNLLGLQMKFSEYQNITKDDIGDRLLSANRKSVNLIHSINQSKSQSRFRTWFKGLWQELHKTNKELKKGLFVILYIKLLPEAEELISLSTLYRKL